MAKMLMDWINRQLELEAVTNNRITYDEWCYIRRNGTPEEIEEAAERMMAQGGYDNLD